MLTRNTKIKMNTTTLKEEILLKYRSDNNFVWTIKIVVEDILVARISKLFVALPSTLKLSST